MNEKAPGSLAPRRDGHLWVIALGFSLLANAGFLAVFTLEALVFGTPAPTAARLPPPPVETTLTIFPDMISKVSPAAAVAVPPAARPRAVRTSEDQRVADRPENPAFIGERNTRATSDRAPIGAAPPLPSQAGIQPKNEDDLETTASDYQDGKPPERSVSAPAGESAPPSPPAAPPETAAATLPPRAPLMQSPFPVETPVPARPPGEDRTPVPPDAPEEQPPEKASVEKPREEPKPTPAIKDPAFKGYQRKTAIRGSISRTGRSALDVEDSPLGRYQAVISRAVEQEWQRNCVRHRDFITPGFLTVRFFVESSGKVRKVEFVGEMETGEVQKGFTLNSIRDAAIPAMPSAVRREFAAEPLEIIFNFYF